MERAFLRVEKWVTGMCPMTRDAYQAHFWALGDEHGARVIAYKWAVKHADECKPVVSYPALYALLIGCYHSMDEHDFHVVKTSIAAMVGLSSPAAARVVEKCAVDMVAIAHSIKRFWS